jgi:hypothetical protein
MAKNKISQKDRILKQLRTNGFVSRNACIRGDYGEIITRLSHYILEFRREGMDIEMKETTNPTETTYYLKDKPKIEVFRIKDGSGNYTGEEIVRKIWG